MEPSTPKLTIGMACYDDFYGVQLTIQSLAMFHALSGCEIVVVDNNPESEQGKATGKYCGQWRNLVRYVPMPENVGTTQSRERIFREARGEAVLACDCHVMFKPGAISRLKHWYEANPQTLDLHHGPLVYTTLNNYETHFNDYWRAHMWGVWAKAWRCTCGAPGELRFTTLKHAGQTEYRDLPTSREPVSACPACGKTLPALPWDGHDAKLVRQGWQPLGFHDEDPPFEIPAQGLGVFSCRREAWLGFNPHFRKFGGEEFYIHSKFRLAGRRVVCLPFLKWWHRFERPGGPGYPNTTWAKMRNYVLGHIELGLALDPVYEHFVSLDTHGASLKQHLIEAHSQSDKQLEGLSEAELDVIHRRLKFSEAEWEALVSDPIRMLERPGAPPSLDAQPPRRSPPMRPQPPAGSDLPGVFEFLRGVKRDLDQHLPLLRELADRCEHVTAIEKRRESTAAFLASAADRVVSYQKEDDPLLDALQELAGDRYERRAASDALAGEPEETDLLFVDSVHSAAQLAKELQHFGPRVRKWIVLRGTASFGGKAEGSDEPGLFAAIKDWLAEHEEWFVARHAPNQYGMTVLSRLPAERPEKPVFLWPPGKGAGTELKKLTAELGIEMPKNCTCNRLAIEMDVLSLDEVRARKAEFVARIKENQERWGWSEKIANVARAGLKALASGLAFRIDWTDPIPGLVDEAIRRAERAEQAASVSPETGRRSLATDEHG